MQGCVRNFLAACVWQHVCGVTFTGVLLLCSFACCVPLLPCGVAAWALLPQACYSCRLQFLRFVLSGVLRHAAAAVACLLYFIVGWLLLCLAAAQCSMRAAVSCVARLVQPCIVHRHTTLPLAAAQNSQAAEHSVQRCTFGCRMRLPYIWVVTLPCMQSGS
jgi:hypothetical protein